MAISRHQRNVLFFDLMVTRRAKHAPYPDIKRLADLWIDAAQNPSFPVKAFEKGTVTYLVKDAEIDVAKETVTLLIEASNKNAPNASYLDHDKRSKRDFLKRDPEGSGHSAHLVVSLKQQGGQPHTYLALLEDVPMMPIHRVKSVLNFIISQLCKADPSKFEFTPPGGSKVAKPYIPRIEFGGHVSDRFQTDIETAKIHAIRLLAPASNQTLGQGGHLAYGEHELEIKVKNRPVKGQTWTTLRGAFTANKSKFPEARISFQPEDGGKSTSVRVDTATGQIIGKDYVRFLKFGSITPPLDSTALDKIAQGFANRVKTVVEKERKP
ncbi:hypothetical protein GRI69_01070 [Erythrobacter vulgaris]|uniref:DUF4747 family protein n=1 Tax=Qipengyuania vulgaris TaxID=291985 RepID=A0A844XP71_9SPHN|nr:hypothetical protein [Qipengyuania vulgaris]MXO46852.1 hypothetical protein [Qipengyuania vulgaris]